MKKQNKKHQNAESIGEKLKTKGLMFFVSFFSCDMQDFNRKAQASCIELTLTLGPSKLSEGLTTGVNYL